MTNKSPKDQLDGFIDKYTSEIGAMAREALDKMRARLPGAIEMVYDNYNALVIGFGPTERASEAILSLVIYPRWVTLCFLQGVKLPDPKKLLKGKGTQVRHIRLEDENTLDEPAVAALIGQAIKRSAKPYDTTGEGQMIIKSISGKQRPRRPG